MSTPLGLRISAPSAFTGTRPFSRIAGTAQPRVMRGTAAAASLSLYRAGTVQSRAIRRHRSRHIISAASDSEVGTVGVGAIGLGALANPIVLASDWTLITTGKGFPEGPYGLFGAAEGVSFLVVFGVVGWSLYSKVKTGSGLPAGPSGLLGAIEGTSFLTVLLTVGAFGYQILQKGSLPGITG